MNEKQFLQGLVILCEVFNDSKELSPAVESIYWEALKKYSKEQYDTAIKKIISTYVYNNIPKPAVIIKAIDGSIEEQGSIAWTYVVQAIRDIGAYQSVIFDDPTINSVIQNFMGGWTALCQTLLEDLHWKEKDFVVNYAICKNNPAFDKPEMLCGISMNQIPVLVKTKKEIFKAIE